MTYEQALQIAIEQLDDAVDYLKAMNKGFPKVEKQVEEYASASNALKDMQTKREWVGLENKERNWVIDEWEQLTRSVKDTEFNKAVRLCKMLEAKLKEKNTL